jgi:hypothetical protein
MTSSREDLAQKAADLAAQGADVRAFQYNGEGLTRELGGMVLE